MTTHSWVRLKPEQIAVGFNVALRILSGWRATPFQACQILRISLSTYRRGPQPGIRRRLDVDQQQRISIVLNIHAHLRVLFNNQDNVRGFVGLKNDNPFFEGRSPLQIMAQGGMIPLLETYRRIIELEWMAQSRWAAC